MGINELSPDDDKKHRRLIDQLRKAGTPEDLRLANVLGQCIDERPCRSAACIHGGRDFQIVSFDIEEKEIHAPARRDFRGRMSATKTMLTDGCLAPKVRSLRIVDVVSSKQRASDDCEKDHGCFEWARDGPA